MAETIYSNLLPIGNIVPGLDGGDMVAVIGDGAGGAGTFTDKGLELDGDGDTVAVDVGEFTGDYLRLEITGTVEANSPKGGGDLTFVEFEFTRFASGSEPLKMDKRTTGEFTVAGNVDVSGLGGANRVELDITIVDAGDYDMGRVAINGMRAYPVDSLESEGDDTGIWDGATEDSTDGDGATYVYEWDGTERRSPSTLTVTVPEPEPEPEPEPGDGEGDDGGGEGGDGEQSPALDLGARVIHYLGWHGDHDQETLELARHHAETVKAYAYGYTRGRGFSQDMVPAPDLAHVIVAAAAKLTANPEQVHNYSTGDYSERPAMLSGWTLLELAVLNRYRKRWA